MVPDSSALGACNKRPRVERALNQCRSNRWPATGTEYRQPAYHTKSLPALMSCCCACCMLPTKGNTKPAVHGIMSLIPGVAWVSASNVRVKHFLLTKKKNTVLVYGPIYFLQSSLTLVCPVYTCFCLSSLLIRLVLVLVLLFP